MYEFLGIQMPLKTKFNGHNSIGLLCILIFYQENFWKVNITQATIMNCTHNLTFMPFGPQLLHQKEWIQVKKRNSKEKGVHSSEAYAGLIK